MEIALGPGLSIDGLSDVTTTATSDPALSNIRYTSPGVANISSLGRGTRYLDDGFPESLRTSGHSSNYSWVEDEDTNDTERVVGAVTTG